MKVNTSRKPPIAHEIPESEAGPRLMNPTISRETKMPIRPLR
jgi:hypothetical protein